MNGSGSVNAWRVCCAALLLSACGGQARSNSDNAVASDADESSLGGISTTGVGGGAAMTTTGSNSVGGASIGGTGIGGTGLGAPVVEDLRFSTLRASQNGYCGITRDDRRLVCVENGGISSELPGPIVSFDMNDQITGWDYRCAVLESGAVECFGETDLAPPAGQFENVSVGTFSACAKGVDGFDCWVPSELGGAEPTAIVGTSYSVDMWSFCTHVDMWHASCVGRSGVELLPTAGHYLSVLAAPLAGCAALLAPATEETPDVPTTVEEVLARNCIACFRDEDVSWKVDGLFAAFDVNVNQDGCALGEPARAPDSRLACWGAFENSVPADAAVDAEQVSVSLQQVCLLDTEGRVSCFPAAH